MSQERTSSTPSSTNVAKPPFDPYHIWLGIPPHEQPANFYRLLSLSNFEDNAEVIALATERQVSHVRMFQSGQHSVLSQKVLNELTKAELCLTHPEKKAAYDAELRRAQASASGTPMSMPPSGPLSTPPSISPLSATPPPRPTVSLPPKLPARVTPPAGMSVVTPPPRRPAVVLPPSRSAVVESDMPARDPWYALKVATIFLSLAGSVVLGYLAVKWSVRDKSREDVIHQPPSKTNSGLPPEMVVQNDKSSSGNDNGNHGQQGDDDGNNSGNKKPRKSKTDPTLPSTVIGVDPATIPTEPSPTDVATTNPPLKNSNDNSNSTTGGTNTTTPPNPPPRVTEKPNFDPLNPNDPPNEKPKDEPKQPAPPQRAALPTSLAQRAARDSFDEVWAGQFAAATSSAAKTAMAEQVLAKMDQLDASAVDRYVMLDKAQELAVSAGNLPLALAVVKQLGREFAVDPIQLRTTVLETAAAKLSSPETGREVAASAIDVSDEATDTKDFVTANRLADLGLSIAKKYSHAELTKTLLSRKELIQEAIRKAETIAQARDKLTTQPKDAAANLLLGEFLCLEEADWEKGLLCLVNSGETDLSELASLDLSTPEAAEDRMSLADRWWNCRARPTDEGVSPYQVRALPWYRKVVANLVGLEKARVESRIHELENMGTPTQPPLAIAPFSAPTARERQRRWARALRTSPSKTNSLKISLVLIPPGEFKMGAVAHDTQAADDEKPSHNVRITRPFYMSAQEITFEQFTAFITATNYETDRERGEGDTIYPRRGQNLEAVVLEKEHTYTKVLQEQVKVTKGKGPPNRIGARFLSTWRTPVVVTTTAATAPVMYVSWNDAVAFCHWLSKKERAKYRLPTEAEWEFACRAGTVSIYSFGDQTDELTKNGNVADATARGAFPAWNGAIKTKDNYLFLAPVARFPGNAFGLNDLHGNVAEWCADNYGPDYFRKPPIEDPQGSERGNERVIRGGSWYDYPLDVRSSAREHRSANGHGLGVGFRVVCEP